MRSKFYISPIQGDHKENGEFSSVDWRKEAKIHYASSIELRTLADNIINSATMAAPSGVNLDMINVESLRKATSLYKSSVLLMGYSLEMMLKSGVVSIYRNIPRVYLSKILKKHSHQLVKVADFIELPISDSDEKILNRMGELVLGGARYPIRPKESSGFYKEVNELNSLFSNSNFYNKAKYLYEKCQKHVEAIKGSEEDPVSLGYIKIDSDGFLSYRIGGNLSARVIVVYSSEQERNNKNNPLALWEELNEAQHLEAQLRILLINEIDDVIVTEVARL